MSGTISCTHVTHDCPVQLTLYRHYPNLGANTFFTILFAVCLVAQLLIGTWKRTWSYMIWVSLGCFGELLGYIGRLIMHTNPFNQAGIEIQIICLVLAPSFLAAGLYLTLKHIVILTGREYSRIRPELYPWVFVGCDVFSILLQAMGGGIAAGGGSSGNESLANMGDNLIIAGIAIQIVSMLIFGFFAIDFYRRKKGAETRTSYENEVPGTKESYASSAADAGRDGERSGANIDMFQFAMAFAYVTIFLRCAYRIHEMARGWYNSRMRNEVLFLVLDGMMIGLASVAMTFAHPGIWLPHWRFEGLYNGNV